MKKLLLFTVLAGLLFTECRKDFIVENIDKKTLVINAPANNTSTTLNLVTFWWDELYGAEQYNLQIVKPDFSKPLQLLLDTNTRLNKFNFSLKPGAYQWRIRATNAGHATEYQVFNLTIDTTSDLSLQFVNLVAPVNGAVTGNTLVTFSWSTLASAKKYRLQINNGLLLDTTLSGRNSLSYALKAAQNATTAYTWNVKAINDASESQFNTTSFSFVVDRKGPATPVLVSPLHAATLSSTDSLKWTRGSDALYDSVYVADDTTFANYQQLSINASNIKISEFNLAASPQGSYYWWKVRSFDAYGNPSGYSLRRKFKKSP